MAITQELNGTQPAGSTNTAVARITADPQREYVAAGPPNWYSAARDAVRALPRGIDDVDTDLGLDIYARMMHDPQVQAGVNIIKSAILEDGIQIVNKYARPEDDGFGQSAEYASLCTTIMEEMETPLAEVMFNMLDALIYGSKLAEQVYDLDRTYTGKQQLVLTALKVKPRSSTQFVVDAFMNVVGILARTPESTATWSSVLALNPDDQPNILPRTKFFCLTNRMTDADPRGTVLLRPAYNAWWLKMQSWPEYLKYLAQFASPSMVGTTAEGALPGEDGKTPEEALLATLLAFRNGTAIALPYSAAVNLIFSTGEGRAFLSAFALFDQQISKAIVNQSLATEEGDHQARAAATVHQDVLGTIIRQMKQQIAWRFRWDVLRPLIRYNFGDKALRHTPRVNLGDVESQDFSATANAVSQLTTARFLHPSQFPELDRMMGLPERAENWEATMPAPAAGGAPESGVAEPPAEGTHAQRAPEPSAPPKEQTA